MTQFRFRIIATALLLLSGLFLISQAQDAAMGMGSDLNVATNEMYGDHLVNAEGHALYVFMNDVDGVSACYDGCAENWPPLTVEGDPTFSEGIDESLVGTTERDDGMMHVTYNGMPLYTFVNDMEPGVANGQGLNEVWYLVNPMGEHIE